MIGRFNQIIISESSSHMMFITTRKDVTRHKNKHPMNKNQINGKKISHDVEKWLNELEIPIDWYHATRT